jgi:hypothetical protein
MPTEYPRNPRGRKDVRDEDTIGWGLPLGVLALLVAGALILSAGPDRTRTAETNRNTPDATKSAPGPRAQPPAAAVR